MKKRIKKKLPPVKKGPALAYILEASGPITNVKVRGAKKITRLAPNKFQVTFHRPGLKRSVTFDADMT